MTIHQEVASPAHRRDPQIEARWARLLERPRQLRPELVVPAGVALVLGLITLGTKAWWWDEGYDVTLARNPWIKFIGKSGYYEPSQALYLVLFKIWRTFTPETEFFTRLPSVLAATAAAALLALLGARLFDRVTGVLAGIFLATNAEVVSLSQQARTYALAELASIAVTIAFLHAMRSERQRPWLIYGAAGAVGAYAHFFVGFVLAAHAVLVPWMTAAQRRLLIKAWAIVAIAFLPALPYVAKGGGAGWIPPTSWHRLYVALSTLSGYNALLLAAAAGGAVALVWRRTRDATPWKCNLVLAWAVAPVAGALLVSLFQPVLLGRYLVVVAPPLALLVAAGVTAIRPRMLAVAAAAAVIAVAAKPVVTWYQAVPEDWRGAARYAAEQERRGATIVVFPNGPAAYWLYAPLPKECHHLPGHFEPRCNFHARGQETLVVTFAPDMWHYLPGSGRYSLAGQNRFGENLVVLRLVRR